MHQRNVSEWERAGKIGHGTPPRKISFAPMGDFRVPVFDCEGPLPACDLLLMHESVLQSTRIRGLLSNSMHSDCIYSSAVWPRQPTEAGRGRSRSYLFCAPENLASTSGEMLEFFHTSYYSAFAKTGGITACTRKSKQMNRNPNPCHFNHQRPLPRLRAGPRQLLSHATSNLSFYQSFGEPHTRAGLQSLEATPRRRSCWGVRQASPWQRVRHRRLCTCIAAHRCCATPGGISADCAALCRRFRRERGGAPNRSRLHWVAAPPGRRAARAARHRGADGVGHHAPQGTLRGRPHALFRAGGARRRDDAALTPLRACGLASGDLRPSQANSSRRIGEEYRQVRTPQDVRCACTRSTVVLYMYGKRQQCRPPARPLAHSPEPASERLSWRETVPAGSTMQDGSCVHLWRAVTHDVICRRAAGVPPGRALHRATSLKGVCHPCAFVQSQEG